MSNWTKLSKHCYVGRIGPATYFVKHAKTADVWFYEDAFGYRHGAYSTAQQAMLAAEEMK